MKIKIQNLFILLTLSTLNLQLSTAFAQGTAFTYQGRLNEGNNPATGIYDLRFEIYDAITNGSVLGGVLTNAATPVTNGLFTVALDFGAGVFTGDPRWLDIAVRTNGSGAFTTLNPRQALLPTPYALWALSAGSVMASNISGVLRTTQLSSNVALLTGSPTFAGTVTASSFSGSGAGLTGLPGGMTAQVVVSGTTVQAQPNTAYLLTNDALVTLTLPSSPNVGDFVRIASTGTNGWKLALNSGQSMVVRNLVSGLDIWNGGAISRNWRSVASSSDGAKLVAVIYNGQIYTSTDSGVTWTAQTNAPSAYWESVASSSDGAKLVAVIYNGQIYTSTDSGVSWTVQTNAPSANWQSVASSSDGAKLVAVIYNNGKIYTSTDSGVSWTVQTNAPSAYWYSVASSSDGAKLVAAWSGGKIYTSTNSGVTWTVQTNAPSANWNSVTSSSDGAKLVAVINGGQIYTSTNSGVNWTVQTNAPSANWKSVASSSDGAKLVAVINGGRIYTSTDSGVNWTVQTNAPSEYWYSVASSSDGAKLVAVIYSGQINGQIYTSTDSGVTWWAPNSPPSSFIGLQYTALELQFIGNGEFLPVSSSGSSSGLLLQ